MCRRWKVSFPTTKMFVFFLANIFVVWWNARYSYCWYCAFVHSKNHQQCAVLCITLLDRNKHRGNRQVLFMMELNTLHVFVVALVVRLLLLAPLRFSTLPFSRFLRIFGESKDRKRSQKRAKRAEREEKKGIHCVLTMKLYFSLLLKLLLVIHNTHTISTHARTAHTRLRSSLHISCFLLFAFDVFLPMGKLLLFRLPPFFVLTIRCVQQSLHHFSCLQFKTVNCNPWIFSMRCDACARQFWNKTSQYRFGTQTHTHAQFVYSFRDFAPSSRF